VRPWFLHLCWMSLSVLMAPGLIHAQSSTSQHMDSEQILVRLMALKPRLKGHSTAEQIRFFANIFYQHKTPYLVDPLGEADYGDISSRPLYRFDGFDCTTFVETTMALSLARDPSEFRKLMNRIRYKAGVVSYFNRNHFSTLDWIPNNERAGFVRDVTSQVTSPRQSLTYIEKDNWYLKKGLMTFTPHPKKSWAQVTYIAKEDLRKAEVLARIPSGSIFNVVRPEWDLKDVAGTALDVSHQGFVVREKGQVYIIHASNGRARDGRDDSMRVKKDLLREYVEQVMMNSDTTAGMNFLSVRSAISAK
jgi:hypothetical protein